MIAREAIAGVILAGGLSRRMGARTSPYWRWTASPSPMSATGSPAGGPIVVSANGLIFAFFVLFCLPVIADTVAGHAGPLAGIHAAIGWNRPSCPTLRCAESVSAADTPFFPVDLAQRLGAAGPLALAVAASGGRVHPVFGLWPLALEQELFEWLAAGNRKVMDFVARHRGQEVDFSPLQLESETVDPFFINTPEDLERAQALARLP